MSHHSLQRVFPGLFVVLWSTGFIGAKLGLPYAEPATFLLQPVLTAVLGGLVLGERTGRRQWLGLGLGLAGVLQVVGDRIAVERLALDAVLLSVLALASITLGTVWQKRHGAAVDLRTGAAIQFIAAALVMAPFSLFETREVRWSAEFVFALGWLVVVLSLGAVFLLLRLIRRGAATRVASLFYLVPPTTALIAWPLFGETYTLAAAAGMGLGMLAVWLVTR